MVFAALKQLNPVRWRPEEGGWVYLAQVFIGLFFLCAGTFKLMSYFIIGDQSLAIHFQFWFDSGFTPDFYAPFLRILQQHWKPIAGVVAAIHLAAGLSLITNWHVRWFAAALLLLQLNIFLALTQHQSFIEFVGISLWISLYFIVRPKNPRRMNRTAWTILTLILFVFCAIAVRNRIIYDDPWLSSFAWKRAHFAAEIMPTHLLWKQFVLWVTSGMFGALLWASAWWVKLLLTLGLLTKWRLYAGTGLLIVWMLTTVTWLNSVTAHGVLWVLTLFAWVTQEQLLSRH